MLRLGEGISKVRLAWLVLVIEDLTFRSFDKFKPKCLSDRKISLKLFLVFLFWTIDPDAFNLRSVLL